MKFFLFVPLLLLLVSCSPEEAGDDPIPYVNDYKPDDKYFRADVMNMFFLTETRGIDEVDTLFTKWIKRNDIPVTFENVPDGEYHAASPRDAYGYAHVVTVSVKNGKLTGIDYNEVHFNGKDKEEDSEYNLEMSVTGASPDTAYPFYEKEMLKKQNYMEVDAVSGATYSLYRFRYALALAVIKAATGAENK